MNSAKTFVVVVLLLSVAACGGGSSGDGGGGGGGGATMYTVGGTVTGLSGTGLKIRNNTTDLDVTANGAFTFPAGLASAATYDVTVVAQPGTPTQVCTVANGSGTVGSSNITTVAVTCTTPTTPVYTVSGTVTGLSGSGLALLANTTNVDITANGAFTFPVGLADAASYLVTVVTQPSTPAQVCTVANGSGTVSGANVTNITITCTTPTTPVYTIGGTVTGLSGSGLTIRNNTTDLPITANGAFTFGTPLASGVAYSVTVVTQPSAPAQVCTIANGSGTVASSNITNVTITCTLAFALHQWETPKRVGTGNGGPDLFYDNPQVAFDKHGNAIAVWSEQDPTTLGYSIWWNQFSAASSSWGTAAQLDATAGGSEPQIAFDQDGNALAVWQRLDTAGTHTNIWSSRLAAGNPWSPLVMINTPNGSPAQNPQIAIDAAGNAVAVWNQKDTGSAYTNILSNRLPASGSWGTPVKVSIDDSDAFSPQIALDAAGNALAVWETIASGTSQNILSSRLPVGSPTNSPWGTPLLVNSPTGGHAYGPHITFDQDGNALAVWQQYVTADDVVSNILSSRLPAAAGSAWATPQTVNTDSNSQVAQGPQIAIDSSGNALVVWDQATIGAPDSSHIWANRYVASASNWAVAAPISEEGNFEAQAQVAFDASGNALAVWIQNTVIASNSYTTGSGWGAPAAVATGVNSATNAQIAFDANGNAMAVWEQLDNGNSDNVWSSRFDTPGQ
jgi:hypothetical protein